MKADKHLTPTEAVEAWLAGKPLEWAWKDWQGDTRWHPVEERGLFNFATVVYRVAGGES